MRANFSYAIFFLSGICGLGYQIVWSRLFAFGLGHELPGVLAVLAAFFGGLALGSWTLDRTVSQSPRPGRWYAGLEIVIGLWGLVSLTLIPAGNSAALRFIGLEPSAFRHWAVAFLVPFLVLLPATTAMGATFPAMERFVSRLEGNRRCVAKLYGANTLGAVVGTLAGTFVVLPLFGFRVALATFAGLNLFCGVAMFLLESRIRIQDASAGPAPQTGSAPWPLKLTVFLTGMLGLGYEVLGVRVMAEVLENTIYSFAAALAVYLLGTAIGAALYQRWARRVEFQSSMNFLLWGISTACVFGAWMLSKAQSIYDGMRAFLGDGLRNGLVAEAAVAVLVFGLPTVLMGAAYSHLVQWARRDDGGVGQAAALNMLGSALAPVLFGVVLLPAIGAKWSMVLVSIGYLVLLMVGSDATTARQLDAELRNTNDELRNQSESASRRLLRYGEWKWLALGLPLAGCLLLPQRLQFVQKPPGGEVLEYRQGVMDSVAVVRYFDGNRSLLVNNRFIMGGTGAANAARRHAQIPLLLHPEPKRALFLGLGTGITFAAAGTHPGLQSDGVELVPEVLEVLNRFAPENSLRPGLKLFTADARRFVRVSETRYDVIVADLFHPARDGAGSLYTVEHFQGIRRLLAEGGLFCQWLPLFQLDEPMLRVILRTFLEVFPNARAYLLRFNLDTPVVGLVATLEPFRYPPDWFESRLRDPELGKALKPLTLTDRFQLFGLLLANAGPLREYARGAELNTDDHPVVIFGAPRFAYQRGETAFGRLFALLERCQADPRELIQVENDPAGEKFAAELARFIAARNVYLRGLLAESQGDLRRATEACVESARISPEFSTGYAQGLTIAMQLAKTDPARARDLLQRLAEAQPARPVARELLQRLFPDADKPPPK